MVIKNITKNEHGDYEGRTHFNLFDEEIDVYIHADVDPKYAETCVQHANNLSQDLLDQLIDASIRYSRHMAEIIDEVSLHINDKKDILSFVSPNSITITAPTNENDIGYSLSLDCEWEEEHGMEWTLINNQIRYVGAFEYVDPFKDYYKENDEYNYVSDFYKKD